MYSAVKGNEQMKRHTDDIHFVREVNAATQIADDARVVPRV